MSGSSTETTAYFANDSQPEDSTIASLRHRLTNRASAHASPEPSTIYKTTEELLVEKLDGFLSSIESRLDSFDQYFKFTNENDLPLPEDADKLPVPKSSGLGERSRSNSSSSLSSIKSFSSSNLNMIHQRLNVVKQSVLKTSFTNLEYLYKSLDDQYNYLFSSTTPPPSTSIPTEINSVPAESNHKEILSRKIITTIQYFDEKLNHVENLIHSKTPQAKTDYNKDSKFKYFKFYNFNRALRNAENQYLHYYELPLSWRENRYIINGYRFSLKHSTMLKSVFHFNHNETMNIWTHIIGLLVLAYITFIHFPSTTAYTLNSPKDNIAMYGFLAAAMACLTSSVVWHTYSCFAKLAVRARCACVDYTGITILITASVVVAEYCSLYNYPKLLSTYVVFSIICGGTGFLFNWSPYFDRPECRSLRIGFFMGLAFLGVTTFFCACFYEGFVKSSFYFLPLVYKSFVWYWLGVVFYGGLVPERWRYDVIINEDENCTHSHTPSDVLSGGIEHSGREEIADIEDEIRLDGRDNTEVDRQSSEFDSDNNSVHVNVNINDCSAIADSPEPEEAPETDSDHDNKYRDILNKHFPSKPLLTPYHRDFFSLWWVDYFFSSHNIWHICVVLGVIGHYSAVLEMYEGISR